MGVENQVAPNSVSPDEPAALFFDADGTLVWSNREDMEDGTEFNDFLPNSCVYEAFARLHERGHQLYLCTGRPLVFIPQGLLDLGFTGCICGGGSCITLGGKIVSQMTIPRDTLLKAATCVLDIGAEVLLEAHETPVFLSPTRKVSAGFPDVPVASSVEELEKLAPKLEFCKLTHMGGPDWHTGEFERMIVDHFVEYDMGMARELTMRGVDKGSAVKRVLELTGHSPRNTYAFGDSENDLPLFDAVETKVAMGNAMACVKERADYVTGHANTDGIPQALEHFGLI